MTDQKARIDLVSYVDLISDDIAWLMQQPRCAQRDHIARVLRMATEIMITNEVTSETTGEAMTTKHDREVQAAHDECALLVVADTLEERDCATWAKVVRQIVARLKRAREERGLE